MTRRAPSCPIACDRARRASVPSTRIRRRGTSRGISDSPSRSGGRVTYGSNRSRWVLIAALACGSAPAGHGQGRAGGGQDLTGIDFTKQPPVLAKTPEEELKQFILQP